MFQYGSSFKNETHISLDYHFVREQVHNGKLQVSHVSTKYQIEDLLTKMKHISPWTITLKNYDPRCKLQMVTSS